MVITSGALLVTAMWPAARAGETGPHQLAGARDPGLCAVCHQSGPDAATRIRVGTIPPGPLRSEFDGVAVCTQCHGDDVSHMVGVEVDFPVPRDLPLSEDNTVMCTTCHKAHGPIRSDRPWANVNFIDRLFDTEAMHKSYLLRRMNDAGQLCLVCHDAKME